MKNLLHAALFFALGFFVALAAYLAWCGIRLAN